jgi:hypothetical protein
MLHIYTRGLIVPEQSTAIVSAFGIREDHVAIRYSRILKEKYSTKIIDCLSILEILTLIKSHNISNEPIILWHTDKTVVNYINNKRKINNKTLNDIVEQIHELLKYMKNVDIQWVQFENNLANLMINQTLLKNKTECFIRKDAESLDHNQLIERIKLLEKENLELQKQKQVFGIELAKRQVIGETLQQQLKKSNQELTECKKIINRVNTEKMIAFMLSSPSSPYVN